MFTATQPLPLAQYSLFHTTDVDEARDCVARIFCPHYLNTARRRSLLDARHHSVRLHQDISLNYVQYGPEVDIDPGYLSDFFLLQIPLQGSAQIRCGDQQVTAHAGMASMPSPSERLSMRWAENTPHLIVRMSEAALSRQWQQLTQTPLTRPLVFDLGVDLQSAEIAPLVHFIHYLYAAVEGSPAFASSALAAQAESFLINSVLTLVTHNQSMVLEDIRRQVVLPRTVRRAQDYMRHNVHEPPLLADLCQAIGVSARSLQTAFQSIFGLSPMSYWRDIRLDAVRDLLRSRSNAKSVTEAANQFGFVHLGHFGVHYRKRFGETPQQTRNRD